MGAAGGQQGKPGGRAEFSCSTKGIATNLEQIWKQLGQRSAENDRRYRFAPSDSFLHIEQCLASSIIDAKSEASAHWWIDDVLCP
jgi:hypothetical protein